MSIDNFMNIRDQVIPIPSSNDSPYRSALLLGTTGAGKTTLLRQIIGTVNEKFPSTSTAKTTIADTEIIVAEGDYQCVVTFMGRSEVRGYLEECISKAVLVAYQGETNEDVLQSLLQHVDQRMRFNYVLGNGPSLKSEIEDNDVDIEDDEDNPNEGDLVDESELADKAIEHIDLVRTNELLSNVICRIRQIASSQGSKLKDELPPDNESDESAVNELFEDQLDQLLSKDEECHAIADELMQEIELRFTFLTLGTMDKTEDGWPNSWEFSSINRKVFIEEVRRFSSNYAPLFGTLLTPLVNGIRVKGPFYPAWSKEKQPIVIIDSEGLGHISKTSSSLSTKLLSRINKVDAVILVDNAKQPMQAAPSAALQSLISTGNINKLLICFTHFDEVKGDDLRNPSAKKNHVRASAKSLMEQMGKDFGLTVKHALQARLKAEHCFFVGGIDKFLNPEKSKVTIDQAKELMVAVDQIIKKREPVEAYPVYKQENIKEAILKGAKLFHKVWALRLGLESKSGKTKEHWSRIKALSKRLAYMNEDEYDNLKPVAEFSNYLRDQIYITIQKPVKWQGAEPDEDSKQQIYNGFSSALAVQLLDYASFSVWIKRVVEWQKAFNQSGRGAAKVRAEIIAKEIYNKAAPVDELLALVEDICQKQNITLE